MIYVAADCLVVIIDISRETVDRLETTTVTVDDAVFGVETEVYCICFTFGGTVSTGDPPEV